MSNQVKLDGNIFGYDTLIRAGEDFIALKGMGMPELCKGMKVILLGDSRGYVPSGFKPGEEVSIVGFTEAFTRGSSDHIVRVTNGRDTGWVKPSNIKKVYRSGIFVSYSHSDRGWFERLQTHLKKGSENYFVDSHTSSEVGCPPHSCAGFAHHGASASTQPAVLSPSRHPARQ